MEQLSDKEREEQRKLISRPLLDEYRKWLSVVDRPAGKLRDAVNYSLNQWEQLSCFVDHGEVEISNNQVENAIRPFVVGRKGWLFSDTPEGAEATAIHFSVIETAKANGLNVENYLLHLLTVLPERFAKKKSPQFDDLLPWSKEVKEAFSLNCEASVFDGDDIMGARGPKPKPTPLRVLEGNVSYVHSAVILQLSQRTVSFIHKSE